MTAGWPHAGRRPLSPSQACALIAADYDGDPPGLVDRMAIDGCCASLVELVPGQRGLIVTGSNDGWDWARNFALLPGPTGAGDSGRLYHHGMIGDARIVWAFARKLNLAWCIGHSRGGGIAQIVGSSLGLPTMTFAAPKVLVSRSQPPGAGRVVNWARDDDPVTWLVPGYRRVGRTVRLVRPWWSRLWPAGHGIAGYRELLR